MSGLPNLPRTVGVTRSITLPDGRELAYEEYGDPDGTPVLSFHGGLSSRLDAAPAHAAALALGVRLLSPDRPGMGRSSPQPGRRLLDWPRDMDVLANALGLDRMAVMGWSCGGPYAAACAAIGFSPLADRVTAVALLSSAIPLDLYGTTKGLTPDDRALLFLVHRLPRLAAAVLRLTIAEVPDASLYQAMVRGFPAVDAGVLRERGSPAQAVAFVKESMRQGTEGCIEDYKIFGASWGFPLDSVTAPVQIWEGTEDHTGPSSYREFLESRLPHARVTLVPGEGHLSLLSHHAPAILGALINPAS
jgi:pimeloyl-ACP methyl ester carboxylesterase